MKFRYFRLDPPVKGTSDLIEADAANLDYKDNDVTDIEPLPSVKQEVRTCASPLLDSHLCI